MMSRVIGGAMLPHAPQFFTMPETEDRNTVVRVKTAAAEIGTRLRALRPDLWIIFANDHVEQFFHTAAPPFTIHVGGEAKGEFAGHRFHWRVPGEIGFEIVRQMYAQGFDPAFTSVAKIDYALGIPLTHLEIADPVLPIYVNAYLPPQPSMDRCYAFGQALARIVSAMGLNTVVLASGGMSHYPGTERYAEPDLAWDREALAKIAAGNLKSLVGYDAAELDAAGNVELRCWACAAGALGQRTPDIISLEPSWHHNYASLGWFNPPVARPEPHYPSIKPELVELTVALHGLAHDEASRAAFLTDAAGYADRFRLMAEQREALIALDTHAIVAMGAHPLGLWEMTCLLAYIFARNILVGHMSRNELLDRADRACAETQRLIEAKAAALARKEAGTSRSVAPVRADPLSAAKRYVAEGQHHIAVQLVLRARLNRDGHAKLAAKAQDVLVLLENSLRLARQYLAQVESEDDAVYGRSSERGVEMISQPGAASPDHIRSPACDASGD